MWRIQGHLQDDIPPVTTLQRACDDLLLLLLRPRVLRQHVAAGAMHMVQQAGHACLPCRPAQLTCQRWPQRNTGRQAGTPFLYSSGFVLCLATQVPLDHVSFINGLIQSVLLHSLLAGMWSIMPCPSLFIPHPHTLMQ